jgi:hypothetical protein
VATIGSDALYLHGPLRILVELLPLLRSVYQPPPLVDKFFPQFLDTGN